MSPLAFGTILLAFSLGGTIKGATGFGLPLVALPVMAAVLGVPHAIAVLAVPAIATNAWQLWQYRHDGEGTGFLTGLLLGGVLGIIAGTWLLVSAPGPLLSLILGLVIIAYLGLRLAKPGLRVAPLWANRLGPIIGVSAGALQGMSGLAAPIGVTFIHSLYLERAATVFSVSAMFLAFALVQMVAIAFAGILTPAHLLEGALALIPALIFMQVGAHLSRRLSRERFDRLVLILLGVMALQLLATSASAMLRV